MGSRTECGTYGAGCGQVAQGVAPMTAPLTLPSSLVSLTGEVLFLLWGIKVCYNVRNAESLYNEARLISYAIYNIAIVNTTMVAFQ